MSKFVESGNPVAFMVMPFNVKATNRVGDGIPAEIDFDALWHRVHQPLLEEFGYTAIRADIDTGALIILDMIRQLAFADLVVADVTLANSNVYYEVGVRHAAQERGCVLVAADWSEPVFDLDQVRRLSYPLVDGYCGKEAVEAAKTAIREAIRGRASGRSPVYEAVPGYPDGRDDVRTAFGGAVGALAHFETDVRAVRLTPDRDERRRLAQGLLDQHGKVPVVRGSVVPELIAVIRDNLGWEEVVSYIEGLPVELRAKPVVAEQWQLALARTGRPAESAAALQQLIEQFGPSSERFGLLGGRYKQLMRNATTARERRRYLREAIEAYEHGMMADLNDYYPSSNLARLYRLRGRPGDAQSAANTAVIAAMASRASLERNPNDEWARPTLLGAAFDSGDVARARELVDRISDDDVADWKLRSTLDDLVDSVALQDPDVQGDLTELIDDLRRLAYGQQR